MEELDEAIVQMSAKGALVLDDIHPTSQSPRAKSFNLSFSTGKSPQTWKIAIILTPSRKRKNHQDAYLHIDRSV